MNEAQRVVARSAVDHVERCNRLACTDNTSDRVIGSRTSDRVYTRSKWTILGAFK